MYSEVAIENNTVKTNWGLLTFKLYFYKFGEIFELSLYFEKGLKIEKKKYYPVEWMYSLDKDQFYPLINGHNLRVKNTHHEVLWLTTDEVSYIKKVVTDWLEKNRKAIEQAQLICLESRLQNLTEKIEAMPEQKKVYLQAMNANYQISLRYLKKISKETKAKIQNLKRKA